MISYPKIYSRLRKRYPHKSDTELSDIAYQIWKKCEEKDISSLKSVFRKKEPYKRKFPKIVCKFQPGNPKLNQSSASESAPPTENTSTKRANVKRHNKKPYPPQRYRHLNKSYDEIIEETKGRCLEGTFKCFRCGEIHHNGYRYRGEIDICMRCRTRVRGKSCGSIWALYTPMSK